MKRQCQYKKSDNHSDNVIAVYHGHWLPVYICGFHLELRPDDLFDVCKVFK